MDKILNKLPSQMNKLINSIHDDCEYTLLSPNNGADIGGFLRLIKHALEINLDTDYVFFVHTKTNEQWLDELIDPLISDIDKIVNYMDNNQHVGLVGSNNHVELWLKNSHPNFFHVEHILKKFGIDVNNYMRIKNNKDLHIPTMIRLNSEFKKKVYSSLDLEPMTKNGKIDLLEMKINVRKINKFIVSNIYLTNLCKYKNNDISNNFYFIGGTIFIIRWDILKNYFKNVNMDELIDELPYGKVSDVGTFIYGDDSQLPHAWERVFCMLVKLSSKYVCGYDTNFNLCE